MYFLPIGFVDYKDGDEHIVFNEVLSNITDVKFNKSIIYPVAPNPVKDFTIAGFHLQQGESLTISIHDLNGKTIRTLRKSEFFNIGDHFINFSTKELSSGIYFLHIQGSDIRLNQKFIKH